MAAVVVSTVVVAAEGTADNKSEIKQPEAGRRNASRFLCPASATIVFTPKR